MCYCDKPASDWALRENGDMNNVNDFDAMCRSCHMVYDKTKQGIKNQFAKINDNDVREIRAMYRTGKWLQREIGDIFGIKQSEVSTIINHKTWRHVS